MRILKFGGSSVGATEGILNIKKIVEGGERPAIVVVSALRGVTDALIDLAQTAASGNAEATKAGFEDICARHRDYIAQIIPAPRRPRLLEQTEQLLAELQSILHGMYLIRELTPKTADAVVAYGERLSSLIVAALIDGAQHFDARAFIKTRRQAGKHVVDFDQTNHLVCEAFSGFEGIAVTGGFIAEDAQEGITTNLGRGGSDYTAAIIAAALDAARLEIWTDVDGFMTADPRVIPTAYTIARLSYGEAMELCNFGA